MFRFFAVLGCLAAILGFSSEKTAVVSSEKPEIEQALSIIKPDAVLHNQIGQIIAYLETAGLKVVAARMIRLSPDQAKAFYAVHKDRSFYGDLVHYMCSGPILVQVLEGEDAVAVNRQVMGATDPQKASPGTIRADFGTNVQQNAVHGSDSPENAKKEIAFFFKPSEIFGEK